MRIVIANCYNDNNRGSAALTIAAIHHVKSALNNPSVAVLPLDHDASDDPRHDFRHTLATFPDVEILPPLFSAHRRLDAVRTLASVGGDRLGMRGLDPRAVEGLTTSAMILSRGGVILHAREGDVASIASFVTRTHAFGVARRRKIPVVLYGAQVGPFPSRVGLRVARWVLSPTVLALPRDAISASGIRRLLPTVRVETIPDTCFQLLAIDDVPKVGVAAEEPRADIAIVVSRSTVIPSSTFRETLRRLVSEWLKHRPESRVRFVLQVNGAQSSDAVATEEAAGFLRSALPGVDVSTVDGDLHPLELIELYRSCELVLSSRLHAVLLALAAGTPAVSLATSLTFKEQAVLSELGLSALAPSSEHLAREIVSALATDTQRWRQVIVDAVTSASKRLEAVGPMLRGVLESSEARRP